MPQACTQRYTRASHAITILRKRNTDGRVWVMGGGCEGGAETSHVNIPYAKNETVHSQEVYFLPLITLVSLVLQTLRLTRLKDVGF